TSPYSGAHTGFTGTSLVIDPLTDTFVILLTNSVHPTREWSTASVTRREVSTCVAHALGLVPATVREGWHAGDADARTATAGVAPADQGEPWVPLPGRLEAEHEEPVEVPDGQITGWGQRAVWDGAFPLSAVGAPLLGEVQIRLRLSTDRATRGLGAWVGRLRVLEEGQELFDSDRSDDRREVVADGWVLGG